MANRAQRRQAHKSQPRYKRAFAAMSPDAQIDYIQRNGITNEMLGAEYNRGLTDGRTDAARTCYAALMLVLHDSYGFGKKRLLDVLNKVDRYIITGIGDGEDEIVEVFERFGIRIRFSGDDMFSERVEMRLDEDIK